MHSFYNLLVVGTDERLMAVAANALAEIGGGIAVVDGAGEVLHTWELPLVGIFSDASVEEVREDFTNERGHSPDRLPVRVPVAGPELCLARHHPRRRNDPRRFVRREPQQFLDVVVANRRPRRLSGSAGASAVNRTREPGGSWATASRSEATTTPITGYLR